LLLFFCSLLQRDLCSTKGKEATPLKLSQDKSGKVSVSGLEITSVQSASAVNSILAVGSKNRSVAATACNSRSSRSHTVFTLYIEGVHADGKEKKVISILNLIDLAGSERLDTSKSGSNPQLLKETQHINSSLSALVTCMTSIASKNSHVSFRDSALTHLLKDSLAGSKGNGSGNLPSRTLFFVNISPEISHYNETLCTLRFAEKLKSVELNHHQHHQHNNSSSSSASSLKEETVSTTAAAIASSDELQSGGVTTRRTRASRK
jgi:hypothetical protein